MMHDRQVRLAAGAGAAAFLTVAALASGAAAKADDLAVGARAPDFTAVDSDGVEHTLSDYADGTVVLEWTNHGCPYVKAHYDSNNMQELQAEATADGVTWLTVVSSAPGKQGYVDGAKANALTDDRGASPTAVLLDPEGEVGRLYAAATTPHMFVIHEGALVYQGAIDNRQESPEARKQTPQERTNYVRAALAAVEAGEPPAVASTVAYGCTVKYAS